MSSFHGGLRGIMFAHSLDGQPVGEWEPLSHHLAAVGRRAADFAAIFGLAETARVAGQLHDIGKCSAAFQAYIAAPRDEAAGGRRGPDHSTAGARVATAVYPGPLGRLLAFAIAGHHAGLADAKELDRRLAEDYAIEPYDGWQSHSGAPTVPAALAPARKFDTSDHRGFTEAFMTRMLFSCLVDADFLETEAFYARAKGERVERGGHASTEALRDRLRSYMVDKRAQSPTSSINALRARVLDHAVKKAALPPGLFTLTVPTGGGKTLASLSFALEHAVRHRMTRVVYVIPYTSIIEQTAQVFREALDAPGDVLEHHSSFDWERTTESRDDVAKADDEGLGGVGKLRRAAENWDAPVVVTTAVQFFESLFANRTSRCRKLHNLAGAVIVLDEAQTIPLHVLRPCIAALDELARNYGCTIVLCTATQPALQMPKFDGGFEIGPGRELAPDPARLHRDLKRTTERLAGVMKDDDLVSEIAAADRALVIVNSRRHARMLYEAGETAGLAGLIHLTTRQTAADRRRILADVRRRLEGELPCRLVATSLVEAGVDLDFPKVWRAEAGLDQLTQAAGRCNREGSRPVGESVVTVFKPAEARPPAEIAGLIGDMLRILGGHRGDLFSPQTIEAYFREVYWRKGDKGLDKHTVMRKLLIGLSGTDFAYRTVAENFRLIESGMEPVIVAIDDEPKTILLALRAGMPPGVVARKLRNYVVQVPPRDRSKLIDNKHVRYVEGFGDQFAVLMTASLYTRETGLLLEQADLLGSEQWQI